MQKRQLGGGREVSSLGLGCMPMSGVNGSAGGVYGEVDPAQAEATLHRAVEIGVTLFDTAEAYGPFVNEHLLGRALRSKRNHVVIATKFGFKFNDAGQVIGLDGSPANVRRACEGSLQRLGIDCIDIFYQHRIDPDVPLEETLGACNDLIREGKVRELGLCEVNADTLRRAHAIHPIAALQSEYSLWERTVESDVLPATVELGIAFVSYSPLGRGFLAGVTAVPKPDSSDYRLNDPRFDEGNRTANLRIVDALSVVARRHKVSPARVALAWLLSRSPNVVPIPGCKRRVTLEDSMAASELRLERADIDMLDSVAPIGGTMGERHRSADSRMLRRH